MTVKSCFWDDQKNRNKSSAGFENADQGFIQIFDDVSNFLLPIAYSKLVDKTGKWTIGLGDKIVKGDIPDTVLVKDLELEYDDVLNVTSVDPKLFGSLRMHHVEIGAK